MGTGDWMSDNVCHMSDSEEEASVPRVTDNIEIEQKKIKKKEQRISSNQEGLDNTENQSKIKLPTDTLTDDWMSDNVGHMSDSEKEASVPTVTENIEIEEKKIKKKEERMSSNQEGSNKTENQSNIKLPTDTLTDDWMSDNVGHMSDSEEETSVPKVTENFEIEE